MIKPELKNFKSPKHIKDYPTGPSYHAGHLVSINAGWRTFKPVVKLEACTGCFQCYILCPDGAISKIMDNKIQFDYSFCKGCGVCSHECRFAAIEMIKDGPIRGEDR